MTTLVGDGEPTIAIGKIFSEQDGVRRGSGHELSTNLPAAIGCSVNVDVGASRENLSFLLLGQGDGAHVGSIGSARVEAGKADQHSGVLAESRGCGVGRWAMDVHHADVAGEIDESVSGTPGDIDRELVGVGVQRDPSGSNASGARHAIEGSVDVCREEAGPPVSIKLKFDDVGPGTQCDKGEAGGNEGKSGFHEIV